MFILSTRKECKGINLIEIFFDDPERPFLTERPFPRWVGNVSAFDEHVADS